MFAHEINQARNRMERQNSESAFFEWMKAQGLEREGFEMTVNTDDVWKGKRISWAVIQWGHYQVQGGWMVFITYKNSAVNHIRQHTWRWSDGRCDLSTHNLNEFINI